MSVAILSNSYNILNGLMISGLSNVIDKGKGVQIGLINHANNLIGVQIGLWNRNGKRGLPFINIGFKRKR